MQNSTSLAPHAVRRSVRAVVAIASLVAGSVGIGAIGAGTAVARTPHIVQARAVATAKPSKHERRETATVRASETVSVDPTPSGPNEPADSSSTDPSANDEGTGDTSASDVNDSTDSASNDQAAVSGTHRRH